MPISDMKMFQALHDRIPDPVIIADAEGRIISVNPAVTTLFGYEADALIGRPAQRLRAGPDQALSGADGMITYLRRDGTVFTAKALMSHLTAPDNAAPVTIEILRDVADLSAHRHASAINAAIESISEGIAIYDRDERLVFCNGAYRRLFGKVGDTIAIGMKVEDLARLLLASDGVLPAPLGSKDAQHWVAQQLALFRRADSEAVIFRYGTGQWLRSRNSATPDGNIVVFRVDVTELKETELALERQRADYATLVENIPDFITRVGPDLRYTFVNSRFADFVGLSPDAMVGLHLLDFVPEDEPLEQALRALTPDAPITTGEQHRTLADGRAIWILWSNIAVFESDTLMEYVSVGRDVTEIKRQQAHIAEQRAELQRTNAALAQFTSTVSHDLKAPMRHLSMFAEMIADDIGSGQLEEVPVYARHLRQSAARMTQMIDSLLDYARIADRIASLQPVSLRAIVDDALLNLQSDMMDSAADITVGALPDVLGDPELLKRLFQNVIGNAIKYRRPDVPPRIVIGAVADGPRVRISIADNGIGIDPRHSRKIFDVFRRLHNDETVYPGTGIGLALAKRITDSHKGTIELDPTYEGGARFILSLISAPV